jgi:LysR family transcriptional regulator, hydrogen peroxide-inducible genes activator
MNIQQLEYVVAVDRFKSFTKAAVFCNITQATLSAMVKKLEDELGIIIFDRKTNPLLTTDVGKGIVDEGKMVLAHCGQIRDKARGAHTLIEGKIKIGVIPTIANALLPKIIPPLLLDYPQLHLEIVEITTQNIIKQLKEGAIDVGIVATPTTDANVVEEILYYEALMVYGQIDKKNNYIIPDEVKNKKVWLLEEGHCLRDQFANLCALKKKDLKPNNLSFDANSFDTLLNMVDAFGGLTLIPELYYQTLPKEKKEKVYFFKAPVPVREVCLIYYRPYAKQRVVRMLAEFIQKTIQPILLTKKYKKTELVIAKV